MTKHKDDKRLESIRRKTENVERDIRSFYESYEKIHISNETKDPEALAIMAGMMWPGTTLAVDNRVLLLAQSLAEKAVIDWFKLPGNPKRGVVDIPPRT